LGPIANFLNLALRIVELLLFAYIILSWVQLARSMSRSVPFIDPRNPVVRFLEGFAYTILHPVRRVLAPYQRGMPIDLSVIVVYILIEVFRNLVVLRLPF